jgi:signal transduction histidine kinase
VKGLPQEWEVLLKTSGISKEEVLERPDQVLDLLHFNKKFQDQQLLEAQGVIPIDTSSSNELPEEEQQSLSTIVEHWLTH